MGKSTFYGHFLVIEGYKNPVLGKRAVLFSRCQQLPRCDRGEVRDGDPLKK
jgi:hypothetical protein